MKRILLFVLASALAWGQATQKAGDVEDHDFYSTVIERSLSGAGEVVTIQTPANAKKRVFFKALRVYCSADCTVDVEKGGSTASGTAVTAVGLNTTGTPTATVYRSSTSTGGAVADKYGQFGEGTFEYDLSYVMLPRGASSAQNFTFRVGSMTGTLRMTLVWGER